MVVLVLFMVFLAARAPLAAAIGLLVAGGQHCLRAPIHGDLEGRKHADAFVPYVPEAVGLSFWGAAGFGSGVVIDGGAAAGAASLPLP